MPLQIQKQPRINYFKEERYILGADFMGFNTPKESYFSIIMLVLLVLLLILETQELTANFLKAKSQAELY